MLDKPRDIVNENGDVLPSYEDEGNRPIIQDPYQYDDKDDWLDHLSDQYDMSLEDKEKIADATSRVVGELALGKPAGRPKGVPDAEWFKLLQEEREADRSGTHPGSSKELTAEEKAAAKKADKERQKAIKLQKKIDAAKNLVSRINPSTRDASLAKELSESRAFLIKNGINPDDYLPEHWK